MASVKAQLNPKVNATGWPGFLLWARQERPAQYAALVAQVPVVADFENALKNAGLGDFSDILSSIGSGLASAGSTIANVFTNTAPALLSFGTTLVQAKAAQNLTNTQLQLAQAQRPPAQTATIQTANGPMTVPVASTAGGYAPMGVNAQGQFYTGSTFGGLSLTTWLLIAGVGLTALLVLKRR